MALGHCSLPRGQNQSVVLFGFFFFFLNAELKEIKVTECLRSFGKRPGNYFP